MNILSILSLTLLPAVFATRSKYYEPPTTSPPTSAPTCISNPANRKFSCECFNNDPWPFKNCPRTDCVYDFDDDGCDNLPSGGAGNIPDGNPIQCDLNASPDQCVDVNGEKCTNSANPNNGCSPIASRNGRVSFGCCKSMCVEYITHRIFLFL